MASKQKQLCIICYGLINPPIKPNTEDETGSEKFLQLFTRHLEIGSGFQLNSGKFSTCEDCSKLGESFCELYTQLELIRVQLDCKIGCIYERMTFADRVRNGLRAIRTPGTSDSSIGSDFQGPRSKLMHHCKLKLDSKLPRVNIEQGVSNGRILVKPEKRSPPKQVNLPNDKPELLQGLMTFLAVLHLSFPLVPSLIPTHLYRVAEQANQFSLEIEEPAHNDSEPGNQDDLNDTPLNPTTKSSKRTRSHGSSNNEKHEDSDDDDESSDEVKRPRIPGKAGDTWVVEAVRDYRIGRNNKVEYRTKWKHWPECFNSWEPESNFISKKPIQDYWKEVIMEADKLNTPFKLTKNRGKNATNRTDPSYFLEF